MISQVPPASALAKYLERTSKLLYGKLAELRREVTRLLTYVPQTFEHYTSHTIEHSDQIVLQISKILFSERTRKPTVELGPVATYILIAGAYLHDAGMVVSEREKQAVLESDDWRAWTTEGSGRDRWQQIQVSSKQVGQDLGDRLAVDRATRWLIAEYVRRQHHQRAGELVRGRTMELGRIDVGDPMLREAIAEICVAHGLDRRDLEDDIRFPEARDIQGETVNLRLLATLLRLGDLLDLDHDRACPLLLQAANPLPAESIAHWTQYRTIKHRHTSPERIEIRAECGNPDEHRVLQDWCTWLVQEIESLPARLPRTDWKPPQATMHEPGGLATSGGTPSATITIKPVLGATYIPGRWKFDFDRDAVLERLMVDVYTEPEVFIRELIQNALDATRCQMYEDMKKAGVMRPDFPPDAAPEWRNRYRITVRLRQEAETNPTTKEIEHVQYLSVADPGIGMDQDIIERYFLQIGRSYYTTGDFRRAFAFHPTSRFGIGFLSVFAVSDNVMVETYKPSSPRNDGPIRVSLTGPRNYILVEKGTRESSGTHVGVRLRRPVAKGLTGLVRQWCAFVEFPIDVIEHDQQNTIHELNVNTLSMECPDPIDPSIRHARRVFPLTAPGIRGGLVVRTRIEAGKERWDDGTSAHPIFGMQGLDRPSQEIIALHGISVSQTIYRSTMVRLMVDLRRPFNIPLSRASLADLDVPEIIRSLDAIVSAHLGSDAHPSLPEDHRYRARLASDVLLARLPLWWQRRDMLRAWRSGRCDPISPKSLLEHGGWCMLPIPLEHKMERRSEAELEEISRLLPDEELLLDPGSYNGLRDHNLTLANDNTFWMVLLDSVQSISLTYISEKQIALKCKTDMTALPSHAIWPEHPHTLRDIAILNTTSHGFDMAHFGSANRGWTVINASTDFGRWYQRIVELTEAGDLPRQEWQRLAGLLWSGRHYTGGSSEIQRNLEAWNVQYRDAEHLLCPTVQPSTPDSDAPSDRPSGTAART